MSRAGKAEYRSAFGKALDEQLTKTGILQADLARVTNVSPTYIQRLRNGGKVSPKWADLIADVMDLTPEQRVELHTAAATTWGFKLDLTKK